MRNKITKEELEKVTSDWLDKQNPETFDNPVTRIAVEDEGEYDADAEAKQWANTLPDKNIQQPFVYGFVPRTN